MSLKLTILNYLKSKYPEVVHKGEIGRKAVLDWGYENENAGRRCRELENEGLITKIENKKHEAMYRYNQNSAPGREFYPKADKCCVWNGNNGLHAINCSQRQEVKINQMLL